MLKLLIGFIVGCNTLCLVACNAFYKTSPPVVSVKGCEAVCTKRLNVCGKICHNNCPRCTADAAQKAAKYYAYYAHEQYIKGKIIALELNSFRDPLQCRKITCNCWSDYQVCVKACGGKVIKKRWQHALLCS